MKTVFNSFVTFSGLFAVALILGGQMALASAGGGHVGGGDIQCDNLIQNLTFQDPQGNLQSWLQNDGPEKQNPKLDLSSSLNPDTSKPYTPLEYEKAMLGLIAIFKNAPDVNCVSPGDKGYPVDVNDTAKICKTLVDENGVHMTCDRALFMGLSPDEQIEQDHHEFAINVPGLEPDIGSISTYKISTQLSKSIETVKERRLVVSPNTSDALASDFNGKDLNAADLSIGSVIEFKTMNSIFQAKLNQLSIGSIVVAVGYGADMFGSYGEDKAYASCYFSNPTSSQVNQTVVGDFIFTITSINQADLAAPVMFSGNATLDGHQKGQLNMICKNDLGSVTVGQLNKIVSQEGGTLAIASKSY